MVIIIKLLKKLKNPTYGYNFDLYGWVFSDFYEWTANDVDGENNISGYIDNYKIDKDLIQIEIGGIKNLPKSKEFKLNYGNKELKCLANCIKLENNSVLNVSKLVIEFKTTDEAIKILKEISNIQYCEYKPPIKKTYNHYTQEGILTHGLLI